jgi:diketogulonate reductase-like aldo/keto reductase
MIFRPFGTTGITLPVVGQGTWHLGEDASHVSTEIRALHLGIDMGMVHIDTAEMYGNGSTEELVGRAIAGLRDRLFLTSKVLPSNASYEGTLRACERSLQRLGTDWIDLYLLHWWSHQHPIEETLRAMDELIRAGKIRFAGVSNLDTAQLSQIKRAGEGKPIICDQICYHLMARGVEFSLVPYCRENNIAVVGYSPFGSGNFPSPRSKGGKVLDAIGKRHGKSARQVVLNFLTHRYTLFTIPKAASPEHVRENAAAVGWELTAGDVAEIDQAFPPPTRETPLEIL